MKAFPNNDESVFSYFTQTNNLMEAHVRCYNAIKRSKNGVNKKVGAVMNVMQFEPQYNWDLLTKSITNNINSLYNGIW